MSLWTSDWLQEQSSRFGRNRRRQPSISLLILLLLRLLLQSFSGCSGDCGCGCCCRIAGRLRLNLQFWMVLLRSWLGFSGKEILYFLCNVPSANIVKRAHFRTHVRNSSNSERFYALMHCSHLQCLFLLADLRSFHLSEWRIIDFHPRNDGNYPKLEQKRPETLSKHISLVEFRRGFSSFFRLTFFLPAALGKLKCALLLVFFALH